MTIVIAVVEDDPDQRENYRDVLTAHGYEVRTYPDRPTAEAAFNLELPDLAMLDIMLGEDMNGGFDLCMQLRNMSSTLPIIFLTARDSDADRISSQRDLDVEEGVRRSHLRDSPLDRFESEAIEFKNRIRTAYLRRQDHHSTRIVLVDASRSIQEIEIEIAKQISDLQARPDG